MRAVTCALMFGAALGAFLNGPLVPVSHASQEEGVLIDETVAQPVGRHCRDWECTLENGTKVWIKDCFPFEERATCQITFGPGKCNMISCTSTYLP